MNNNLTLGEFETEQEAAYAYNVGEVLFNFTSNLKDLNCGLSLTSKMKQNVENQVTKLVRETINLPSDFRFPSKMREVLDKTYRIIEE